MDIHQYEKKYEMTLEGVKRAGISDANKETILRFRDDLILDNISKPRIIRYMQIMICICKRLGKDLDKAEIADLKRVVSEIQQHDYSPWTKHTYKIMIKRFYKWLTGTPGKEYPPIVSWISGKMSRSEAKLPSEGDLITENDVKKLLETAQHPRDKAFISVLWESGARISEIGNLKLKNVLFDNHGILLSVQGKTGSRKIRIISSTPYLSLWKSIHPQKDNPEAPLWVNIGAKRNKDMMLYTNMAKMIRLLFNKAGIKKRCNPHLFRHSRATFMANYLTEFQMNQHFGWIQGSDMPSTYVHMSGKEVDQAILAMNGINVESQKEEQKLKPKICPRCDTINTYDSNHCCKCGGILDLKHAMELEEEMRSREKSDQVMNQLLADKAVKEFLSEKLKGLGIRFSA